VLETWKMRAKAAAAAPGSAASPSRCPKAVRYPGGSVEKSQSTLSLTFGSMWLTTFTYGNCPLAAITRTSYGPDSRAANSARYLVMMSAPGTALEAVLPALPFASGSMPSACRDGQRSCNPSCSLTGNSGPVSRVVAVATPEDIECYLCATHAAQSINAMPGDFPRWARRLATLSLGDVPLAPGSESANDA
jgi:hypothetical protein